MTAVRYDTAISSSFSQIFQVEVAREDVAQAETYKNKSRKKKVLLAVISGVAIILLIILATTLG